MPSIIERYNYDIFISYRQKDNKGDRWVSEFVNSLKTELESTFKEEISVYFDINPHDGLLETHDVDASLKEKLKCLVFIPIISRTYCDPKSFAWENEFKAFVEEASKDQFGLKVRLINGNVSSRVLPIRIHDLDSEDVRCFEEVIGSVLRTLDFVFKTSSGVNRPLKSREDHPGDNLNKTYYQDQINKVALAIKEIVLGMKTEPSQVVKAKDQPEDSFKEIKEGRKIDLETLTKAGRWKLLSAVIIVAVLIIASVFAYPKIFKKNSLERFRSSGERISIVVLPFQNMTNDTVWDVWQDGVQNELITSLSSSEELNVRLAESITGLIQSQGLINYASITPSIAATLSQKLNSVIFIYGTIKQAGQKIRLNAQLIDSRTEEVLKSFLIEGLTKEGNIFPLIDSLSYLLKDFLILSKLIKEFPTDYAVNTTSPEAYRCFIYGNNAVMEGDNTTAIKNYSQAVAIDSNFIAATIILSGRYFYQGMYDEAKKWCLKVYNKRDQLPKQYQIMSNWIYALLFETPQEVVKYLKESKEFDDQVIAAYYLLGTEYLKLDQYDKAILEMTKALEIYKKWDSKPAWGDYAVIGEAYHKTGQFKKERKLYKKAEKDWPDNLAITWRQSVLALTEGDTIAANRYLKKFISYGKNNSWPEEVIENNLAALYNEAGIFDKAEEYYRKVLSSAPERPARMNNLAWFLIDNDRNINEGLDLIDNALKSEPDNYLYLDTKGWGLFKQGKYQEALEFLEKSWALKPVYDHEVYLHLEAAKKAVAGLNKKN